LEYELKCSGSAWGKSEKYRYRVRGGFSGGGCGGGAGRGGKKLTFNFNFDEMLQLPAPSSSGTFDTRESGIQSLVFYRKREETREDRKK
jgi:hypothetical protein